MAERWFTADQVRPHTAIDANEWRVLRPFVPGEAVDNGDGTHSTERTVTVPDGKGKWLNLPSLWMGPNGPVDFGDAEDAIVDLGLVFEKVLGKKFPRFDHAAEAEKAARIRSSYGGAAAPK